MGGHILNMHIQNQNGKIRTFLSLQDPNGHSYNNKHTVIIVTKLYLA